MPFLLILPRCRCCNVRLTGAQLFALTLQLVEVFFSNSTFFRGECRVSSHETAIFFVGALALLLEITFHLPYPSFSFDGKKINALHFERIPPTKKRPRFQAHRKKTKSSSRGESFFVRKAASFLLFFWRFVPLLVSLFQRIFFFFPQKTLLTGQELPLPFLRSCIRTQNKNFSFSPLFSFFLS